MMNGRRKGGEMTRDESGEQIFRNRCHFSCLYLTFIFSLMPFRLRNILLLSNIAFSMSITALDFLLLSISLWLLFLFLPRRG